MHILFSGKDILNFFRKKKENYIKKKYINLALYFENKNGMLGILIWKSPVWAAWHSDQAVLNIAGEHMIGQQCT